MSKFLLASILISALIYWYYLNVTILMEINSFLWDHRNKVAVFLNADIIYSRYTPLSSDSLNRNKIFLVFIILQYQHFSIPRISTLCKCNETENPCLSIVCSTINNFKESNVHGPIRFDITKQNEVQSV